MFTLSGSQIAQLRDDDLRELVVRLCEAELRAHNLPVSAITAGGHQDAPDGGLDVRVNLETTSHSLDFIPKPNTGFQVKVPAMSPSAIKAEMVSEGKLREAIVSLVEAGGAYVIVSSKANVPDGALQSRLNAMKDVVAAWSPINTLTTDFYDQTRVAYWLRQYPGVGLWVRSRLGISLHGWQTYANWSAPAEPLETPYLFDDKVICFGHGDELTAENALNRVREKLSQPQAVVRLVGLSGVGKTRFAQALFDDKIGTDALPPSLAVYTGIGHEPDPAPQLMLERLIHSEKPAMLVIDNCSPELHRSLLQICASIKNTSVSLLTIEYDVREDEPEDTEVVFLKTASDEVIVSLIENRFPAISNIDANRISEFSSGNARIALALCRSLRSKRNFSSFSDEQLLRRLFVQRNNDDETLWKIAEVCSLVYSFDGETSEGDSAEWPILASLAGVSRSDFHRGVQKLIDRELVQCRGRWRALLPHALANKLADKALSNLAYSDIVNTFEQKASLRMLTSFARRLGYLHSSPTAKQIAKNWLSSGGILAENKPYTEDGWAILTRVAPILPQEVLDLIDGKLTKKLINIAGGRHSPRHTVQSLLLSLAYEEQFFTQAARLLSKFGLPKRQESFPGEVDCQLPRLYRIFYSGTHAAIKTRLAFVDELLSSGETLSETLACQCLDSMFHSGSLHDLYTQEFGAVSRDYGYWPASKNEYTAWCREVLFFILSKLSKEQPFYDCLCDILARHFRRLVSHHGLIEEIEAISKVINEQGFWKKGWHESLSCYFLDGDELDVGVMKKLEILSKILQPTSLLDKVRAYAIGYPHDTPESYLLHLHDHNTASQNICDKIQILGEECAADEDLLNTLLPELLHLPNGNNQFCFGVGLASAAKAPQVIWSLILQNIQKVHGDQQSTSLIEGFIQQLAKDKPELTATFLDEAVIHPGLAKHFPHLQCGTEIDAKAIERLQLSLKFGVACANQFWRLGIAKISVDIDNLIPILETITEKKAGAHVVMELLRFLLDRNPKQSKAFKAFVRKILLSVPNYNDIKDGHHGYTLGEIIRVCFTGAEATEDAKALCSQVSAAIFSGEIFATDMQYAIEALFEMYPEEALVAFVENGAGDGLSREIYWNIDGLWTEKTTLVDKLPLDNLLIWAKQKPEVRFPALALAITQFETNEEGHLTYSKAALAIIEHAPNLSGVLKNFFRRLLPCGSIKGSYSDALHLRVQALEKLKELKNEKLTLWACKAAEFLENTIKNDEKVARGLEERFE